MYNRSIAQRWFLFVTVLLLSFSAQPFSFSVEKTTQAGPIQSSALSVKIDAILKNELLAGAIAGVSIRKANTGEIIYSSMGDTRLHPASNMKLLTAAAALENLGSDYRFLTEVWMDGRIKGNTLHGNLYLKGKGDPTLLKENLDQFAKDLKAKGIQKINGHIIGDDSWYDDVRLSQDLNWSDESNYTGAQISALTLSPSKDYVAGTVQIEAAPAAKVEEPARLTISPVTDYVKIINQTKTVEKEGVNKLLFKREHGSNTLFVKGTIPLNGDISKSWVTVWGPTQYVLEIFNSSLQDNGIEIRKNSELKIGVTPKDARLLAMNKSMPLKDLIVPFMKLSNNGIGEVLTKEIGKAVYDEGSWDKGLQVMQETMTGLGIDSNTIMLRDGSGMSHKNMLPANELTQLLYAVQEKSWFPDFENSLPIAGIHDRLVGGTLRSRLTEEPENGNVKAKTGSITGVSALSGYVTTKKGDKLIFSILINNHLSESVKTIEDEIIKTIVRDSAAG